MQRLLPAYRAAKAGPNGMQLETLFRTANRLRDNGDLAMAMKVLAELETLVKRTAAPTAGAAAAKVSPTSTPAAPASNPQAGSAPPKIAPGPAAATATPKSTQARSAAEPQPGSSPRSPTATVPPGQKQTDEPALQAEWKQRVIEMEPRILDAQKNRKGEAKWMSMFMTAQDLGSEGDFAKALAVLDRLEGLLNSSSSAGSAELNAALARWTSARATVISQLDKLRAAIEADGDETADAAIVEIRAVQANLSAKPDNAGNVADLMRYLENDDVVADLDEPNDYQIPIDIQIPLLEALDEIELHLPK
jgi:hypothetical protein